LTSSDKQYFYFITLSPSVLRYRLHYFMASGIHKNGAALETVIFMLLHARLAARANVTTVWT
jgi:hypothetical protein